MMVPPETRHSIDSFKIILATDRNSTKNSIYTSSNDHTYFISYSSSMVYLTFPSIGFDSARAYLILLMLIG